MSFVRLYTNRKVNRALTFGQRCLSVIIVCWWHVRQLHHVGHLTSESLFTVIDQLRSLPVHVSTRCYKEEILTEEDSDSDSGTSLYKLNSGIYITFLRLFCRMRNRSLVSEREFTRLIGRSVGWSVDPWVVNFCLYFRWPMHNLTWRREKCRRMVRQMRNIVKQWVMR